MAYDSDALVRAALTILKTSPATKMTNVARACGVSRPTLSRAFVEVGQARTGDVRKRLIIQRLEVLMTIVPPASIKEISAALGFASPQSLARWVKREIGMVPAALRRDSCRRLGEEPRTARGGGDLPTVIPPRRRPSQGGDE